MPWWQVWNRFLVKSGSGRYTTNGYKTSWDFFTDSMKEQGVSDTAKLTATHIEEFIVTLRTRKWRGRLMGIDSVRRHIKGARRVLRMCGMDQVFQGVAMPEGHADKARRLCFTEDDLLAI